MQIIKINTKIGPLNRVDFKQEFPLKVLTLSGFHCNIIIGYKIYGQRLLRKIKYRKDNDKTFIQLKRGKPDQVTLDASFMCVRVEHPRIGRDFGPTFPDGTTIRFPSE